jgi:hypothetical protein
MELLRNYIISAIRTGVPLLVGLVAQWAATKGVHLDSDLQHVLAAAIAGVAGMAYYLVMRFLEHINHRFGWLLGYAKMPDYTPGGALPQPEKPVLGK